MQRLRVLIIVGLFMAGVLAACSPQPGAGVVPPAIEQTQTRTLFNSYEGTVVPAHELRLSYPMAGLLSELLVEEGDVVAAGDTLARLDTTLMDAEVAIAESRLASAQAALDKVLAGASPEEIAEAEYHVQSAGAGYSPWIQTQIDAKAAEQAAAQARLDYLLSLPRAEDVAIAEATVAEMQSAYDAAVARREQAQLVAPLDGTILQVNTRQYEFVSAGNPVVILANLSRLQVRTDGILELELARFQPGDTVELTFESLPDGTYEGVIERMIPRTDPNGNVTFTVFIGLPEIPEGLMLGTTAYISIGTES